MTYLLTGPRGFLGRYVRAELEESKSPHEICLISSAHINGVQTILRSGSEIILTDQSIETLNEVTHLIHIGSFMPKRKDELNRCDLALESLNFTKNLIHLRMPKLSKFTYLSTVDVYSRSVTPMSEASETHVSNAYTGMKLRCEKMIEEFCNSNGIRLEILRSGHLYGDGDEIFDKLVPNILRSVFNDFEIVLQIGLGQQLNLLYVKDAAKVICKVTDMDLGGGISNLVSSHPVTLNHVIDSIQQITSKRSKVKQLSSYIDNSQYNFEPSRLINELAFLETPLEFGLREVCKLWESRQK
jgi:UDP-glucose 4-epimerase